MNEYELLIVYNRKGSNEIEIFGNNFVKNNINNCIILINEKEIKLCNKLTKNEIG